MKSKLIVSAVQMRISSAKKNLFKILKYIKIASKLNSDIICFPECAFNPDFKKPSLEKNLIPVQNFSKKWKIFTVINGYFREKNKNIYNRTYLIDNKGKIVGFYDKIYLWKTELNKINRGKIIKVFSTPLGKIGFLICWDLFFPEIFEKLRNKGAEIIFCSSYWKGNKKETKFLDYLPTVVAYQYMCFFVYCNAFSKSGTSISQIAAPWGELVKIKGNEGIITAKLYYRRLKKFKEKFKNVLYERNLN